MKAPLSSAQAAALLGIAPDTLRRWLRLSDKGLYRINGQKVVIAYGQTGAAGQGRILLSQAEVERLITLMQIQPETSASYTPRIPALETVVVGGETIT